MPIHNQQYEEVDPQQTRRPGVSALARMGPVLQIEVHVPSALAVQIQSKGETIPPPKIGFALIDTGAASSCVDQPVLVKLGLNPIGQTQVATAGGTQQRPIYAAKLEFPGSPLPSMDFSGLISVDLASHFVGSDRTKPIIALIGRDVLQRTVFIYNGSNGSFTFAF